MLKPTHQRALVDIVTSDDYDTPEAMVKALVSQLDELRADDTQYIAVRQVDTGSTPFYFGAGPYSTYAQAVKAIERGHAWLASSGPVAVVPTFSKQHLDQRVTDADTFVDRHKGHWALLREKAGVL